MQRQRTQQLQQQQHDDAELGPPTSSSATSHSLPTVGKVEVPASGVAVESPAVKGRRFQRSRHAEQLARSRSQDAACATKDGGSLLGCGGGSRPLQKSKSVDMNLEKIVTSPPPPPAAAAAAAGT